jgi:hypothetical protein
VSVGCGHCVAVVGAGVCSGCWVLFVGAGFSLVGAKLSFVGGGAHSVAVHIHGWGGGGGRCCSACSACSWVGGLLLFVGYGLVFVGAVVLCCVVTISEIGWGEH